MFYVVLLAFVASGVILLAPEVVRVLGGRQYVEAVYLIPGFVLAMFIQSTTTLFTIILTYDKNITKTAVWTGIIAVLSVVAKILLLPRTGYLGLPYVNIVAFGALFVINYFLVRKAGYGAAVNLAGIGGLLLMVACVMIGGLLLYPYPQLRYAVIAGVGVIFVVFAAKKKTLILRLLKKARKKK